MGALHPDPLLLRLLPALVQFVVDFLPSALHHGAGVDFIGQNALHRYGRPARFHVCREPCGEFLALRFLVFQRRQHPHPVQPVRNPAAALPLHPPGKDIPHDPGRIRVRHQLIPVLPVLAVAVDGKGSYEFPLFTLHPLVAPDFPGDVPAIAVVYEVPDRQHQGRLILICRQGVEAIRYGNEPHMERRKCLLDQPSGFYVIPPEPGQVFYHHTVHLARLHILHQTPEPGPSEIRSRITVVHVEIIKLQILSALYERPRKLPLGMDAVAFCPVISAACSAFSGIRHILPGQAEIYPCPVSFSCLSILHMCPFPHAWLPLPFFSGMS